MKNTSQMVDYDEIRNLPILMTTEQVARLMGVTPKFVRDCLTRNQIKGSKVGGVWRVNRDALLEQLGLCEVRTYA